MGQILQKKETPPKKRLSGPGKWALSRGKLGFNLPGELKPALKSPQPKRAQLGGIWEFSLPISRRVFPKNPLGGKSRV